MKITIATAFIISMIIVMICFMSTLKKKHKLLSVVRGMLIIGFIAVAANLLILLSMNEQLDLLGYCLYFVTTDWVLYLLLYFSLEYIGNRFEKHVNKIGMLILLTVDSLSSLLNFFFGHLFELKPITWFGESGYFELELKTLFYFHYAIILMLVVFCLISLVYGTVKAPDMYKQKYFVISVILLVIIVLNIMTFNKAVDISILGYAAMAVCIFYSTLVFAPQKLLSKIQYSIVQYMTVALIVLDKEGKRIYSNSLAEDYLDARLKDNNDTLLGTWCKEYYLSRSYIDEINKTFKKDDRIYHFKISYNRLFDEKRRSQGCYFTIQDVTEEISKYEAERFNARHDRLTGLYNKECFYECVSEYLNEHKDEELLMICSDIKDFKMINDSFGTKVGDAVLKSFADMMRSKAGNSRRVVYGRLENDIFALMIPRFLYDEDMLILGSIKAFAAEINEDVSTPMVCHMGVYEIIDKTIPVSLMCDRARMAIATIKNDFHNRIAYYDESMRKDILYEKELVAMLPEAMSTGQIQMYLQPQVQRDGKVIGSEALVRWIHPEKGLIYPNHFIPVFERNGLIADVDKYIWESACKLLKKWKDEGKEDLFISVNISPKDFYFLDVYYILTDLVESYGINVKNLRLEITETTVMMNIQRQTMLIDRFREYGFIVEMDDFGSGHSSLNMLKNIHVDVLKLDMEFLRKSSEEEKSRIILSMIIELSKRLGMMVVSEGVETAEQVKMLREMGCDIFQGYYFAKPIPVTEFEEIYVS